VSGIFALSTPFCKEKIGGAESPGQFVLIFRRIDDIHIHKVNRRMPRGEKPMGGATEKGSSERWKPLAILFTDLDGSLLDEGDYSFAGARTSLARIRRAGIPLIFTTSKTRREVERLQEAMGIREPFIVENGGGIFFPMGYRGMAVEGAENAGDYHLIRLGETYPRVRRFLLKAKASFRIRGFGDLSLGEIGALTGLSLEQALLAKEREFTEPFLADLAEDIGPLGEMAAAEGLQITRGGRFHHLIGIGQDKGEAVRIVRNVFRKGVAQEPTAIGIGDSENDLPMLLEVDIPVLIPRPDGDYLQLDLPGLIRAKEPGSRGWNEAVERILDRLEAAPG
jgi:mannosyl-3-phosphoglycerate phosphatase